MVRCAEEGSRVHFGSEESQEPTCITEKIGHSVSRGSETSNVSGRRSTSSAMKRRRTLDVSDEANIPDAVTFGGRRDLLRASPLSTVLHFAGAILRNKAGSAATFDLSEEVKNIDFFISHNWTVARAKKFLCLALNFNLRAAILSVFATWAIAAAAGSLGVRVLTYGPVTPLDDISRGSIHFCCNARLLVGPVFLTVAVFGRELQYLAGFRGCSVFLDKTCIHQTDEDLQRQGILKLGAFLRSSDRMVALYTDIYLTKLWTVYEVACFLSMHPATDLVVVPTYQPVIVFGGATIVYVASLLYPLLWSYGGLAALTVLVSNALAFAGLAALLRAWAREKEAINQRMSRFQVEACTCYSDADRPVVQRNIATLMRAIGDIDEDATELDAMAAFNTSVRASLPTALIASIGPVGLQYWQMVAVMLCTGYAADIVDECVLGVFSHAEEEWVVRYRVLVALYLATHVFGVFPMLMALYSKWCGLCIELRGCKEFAFVATGWLLDLIIFVVVRTLLWRLVVAAVSPGGSHRDVFGAIVALICPASALLAFYTFTSDRSLHEDEQAAVEDQTCDDEVEQAVVADQTWEDDILRL